MIGGAFEQLSCPEGREFEQANFQKFTCPGGCPGGGMLNFRIDRRITGLLLTCICMNWHKIILKHV